MIADNHESGPEQEHGFAARHVSRKRQRLLERTSAAMAGDQQSMNSGVHNLELSHPKHIGNSQNYPSINSNYNIQNQLSKFEEALDTSFKNEDLTKTKEEPKI